MGYNFALSAKDIRTTYRRFLVSGLTPKEAGNLVAKLMGLEPTAKGWTVKELQDMDFYRSTYSPARSSMDESG